MLIFWAVTGAVFASGTLYLAYLGPLPKRAVALPAGAPEGGVEAGPEGGVGAGRDGDAVVAPGTARLALVIGGVGLDRRASEAVLRQLPRPVAIVFSPYAPEEIAAPLAAAAVAQARVCLLGVPMAPETAPRDDAGPRALALGAPPGQNAANLDWALGRAGAGLCGGASSLADDFDGAGFLHSRTQLGLLLARLGARHLGWLDARPAADGARAGASAVDASAAGVGAAGVSAGGDTGDAAGDAPDSATPAAEAGGRAPPAPVYALRADVAIDAPVNGEPPGAAEIDRRLQSLLTLAQARHGESFALGVAHAPTPLLLERVGRFAASLDPAVAVLSPLPAGAPMPAASGGEAAAGDAEEAKVAGR